MERAPLPPHERAWRHPSEVAAGARADLVAEPASASAKLLTASVGACTLLVLAVIVVTFTPERVEDRSADAPTASTMASALFTAGRTLMAGLASIDDGPNVTTVVAAPSGDVVRLPAAADTVMVLTDPPIESTFGRLEATLVVVGAPDGTAVVDGRDRLVGVWRTGDGASRLVPVAELTGQRRLEALAVATTAGQD